MRFFIAFSAACFARLFLCETASFGALSGPGGPVLDVPLEVFLRGQPMSIVSAVLLTLFSGLAILSIVLIHLPVPVKLTIGLIVGFYPIILTLGFGRGGRSLLLGIATALLLGSSALAILSVGIFFLPAALAMLVATVASLLAGSSAPVCRKP